MKRSAVATDVDRGPIHERAQFCERKIAARHDPLPLLLVEPRAAFGGHARRRGAIGRPRGQDDAMPRISGRELCDERREALERPTPERITGAHMNDDQAIVRRDASFAKPLFHGACGGGIQRHFDGEAGPIRRSDAERFEEVPLVLDRVPRSKLARPRHTPRVHPGAAGNLVADPFSCAAQPCEQRRPRAAVEIEREIEPLLSQLPAECEIGEPSTSGRDEDLVQQRAVQNDRRGGRLDDVREMRVGKTLAKRTNGWGGENDVANFAEADKQYLQGSIVASSMSITGMSSLMGYTR
jgi:hypothetical protein